MANKLLEKQQKLAKKDSELWGGMVSKMSSELEQLGLLQTRGKAKGAGE